MLQNEQRSPNNRKSGSSSDRSRSGSPHSRRSRSDSRSQSDSRSPSGSGSVSPQSKRSGSAQSRRSESANCLHLNISNRSNIRRSLSGSLKDVTNTNSSNDADSRSQSPNLQIDMRVNSRSTSGSRQSHSGSQSISGSPVPQRQKSRYHTRSHSPSPTVSVTRRSRSGTGSSTSRSKSGSETPKTYNSRSRSDSDSAIDAKKSVNKRKIVSSESEEEGGHKKIVKKQDAMSNVKRTRIIDSDSDKDKPPSKVDVTDIFGDADDISLSEDDEKQSIAGSIQAERSSRSRTKSKSRSRSSSRNLVERSPSRSHSRSRSCSRSRSKSLSISRDSVEVVQKEDEPEPAPETRIDVEIPRIVTDLGREIHFVKLPNFLSVDTRPFDADTYEDEIDEEETMDEEGRQRIKLKVSNTIRWRELMNNNGEMVKESNARFVRWTDGSMTLHLGNETFDVYKQPLHGDHNHMFIRQGTGLQGQAVFRTKLTFRPHSTESFTHKKMTMSLADRSQKTSGIKILTQVGKDPTTDRLYHLKKEEEKLRQAMRNQHKPNPKKKKAGTLDVHSGANSSYQHDDGSDDENVISLSAIKNKYKKVVDGANTSGTSDIKGAAIYSSDDDDGSDFERRRKKKIDKARVVKALRDSDSESKDEDHDGSDKASSHSESVNADGSPGKKFAASGTGSNSEQED